MYADIYISLHKLIYFSSTYVHTKTHMLYQDIYEYSYISKNTNVHNKIVSESINYSMALISYGKKFSMLKLN